MIEQESVGSRAVDGIGLRMSRDAALLFGQQEVHPAYEQFFSNNYQKLSLVLTLA